MRGSHAEEEIRASREEYRCVDRREGRTQQCPARGMPWWGQEVRRCPRCLCKRGVGGWGGEAGEGGPGQEVEGLECWSKVLRQEV